MKYFVAWLSSHGVVIEEFSNREDMIKFTKSLKDSDVEVICVWAEPER